MNKHKIFIKECYEGKHGHVCEDWKEKILEHYPEFEKEEFKVGDWIVCNDERFGPERITGTRCEDFLVGEHRKVYTKRYISRKATPKEIEQHLIQEAKKRGYKGGALIVSLGDCFESSHCKGKKEIISKEINFDYDLDCDLLWVDSIDPSSSLIIYEKGRWAEIIPTMTKEEAEKKLNCKIV